ncbi:L-asparaginase [Lottiidibacillus patelloidae]|uniref:asparaginase n=1 Tax=Lottiidibacillus patelloidae TaxID=2670334 RepID=A0A263BUN2_9BACI|nr:asparaginase [Lottiidibacillus patelloidae]OZM57252.1 L-asparaginase [Lottiidibacillus patelloidae]
MKKILIIHTGGTIAMIEDKQTGSVKPNEHHPLASIIPAIKDMADLKEDIFLNLPSPHITIAHMVKLASHIEQKITDDHIEGIVITHGTDTLEETAYLLDLIVQSDIPIVVTGAMRSSNELGSDGPHNLVSSIRVALSEEARGQGVLVVLNDEIHTAKNVTKTHSSNIATFQSPQYGPVGIVTKHRITFHHKPIRRDRYQVRELKKNVILLKAFAGMDESLIEAISSSPINGLVIEALGQGNLPPAVVPALQKLLEQDIPIVLVSRCFNGIVQDVYGYDGGGKQLKEMGMIFSNGLNGQKARIKLLVALETTESREKIQQMFYQ